MDTFLNNWKHTVILYAFVISSPLANTACPTPRPYGSLVASRGASTVVGEFASAVRKKQGEKLVRLFTDRCLTSCRGFTFSPVGRDGALHRFRWTARTAAGSLADDLYGQLNIYKLVSWAEVHIDSLSFEGQRRATARLTVAVDGVLRDGARRSDRGILDVELRQSADETWRIDGFAPGSMRTVVATTPLFSDASKGKAPHTRRTAPAQDPAEIGADQGPGLAVADVNGDGRLDVFLPGPHLGALYYGDGKGGFVPGPILPGHASHTIGRAAVFGDVDNDGDPDLFVVAQRGGSRLLLNQGGTLRVGGRGLTLGNGSAAAWLDVDGDGRLDLFFSGTPSETSRPQVLMNRKAGFQADASRLPKLSGRVVAACTGDLNGDGRTDLVLVDALGPVRVLLNRDGRLRPAHTTGTVMGRACSIADLNGDGALDVVIAAVATHEAWKFSQPDFPLPGSPFRPPRGLPARLSLATQGSFWLRNTNPGFTRAELADTASLGWDVTVAVTDLDGDGRADVLLAGGNHAARGAALDDLFFTVALPQRLTGRSWPRLAARAGPLGATRGATLLLGHAGGWTDIGTPAGLEVPTGVRAAVWADLDRDTTPELLLRLRDGSVRIWRWSQRRGNSLTLRLTSGVSAGATVTAWSLGRRVSVNLDGGNGDGPAGEVRLGLGSASRADRVEIRWPDGQRQLVQDLNTGASYTIFKGVEDPTPGLSARRPAAPRTTPPRRPPPPQKPGELAGLPLEQLGGFRVVPPRGPSAPQPLSAFFGRAATVLLFPPTPCPNCPGYGRRLSQLGQRWKRRGVSILIVTPSKPTQRLVGVTQLRTAAGLPAGTLSRLLVLDSRGRAQVVYLGKLPDPLVLQHHLVRLTAQ
ncbi:MAG: CRTAC1 family protein [bacterium]